MPRNVQNDNVDANLYDVLHDVVVHSRVQLVDVVFLVDDVDKVKGQKDDEVLDFLTVLDGQGDVQVSLCDPL